MAQAGLKKKKNGGRKSCWTVPFRRVSWEFYLTFFMNLTNLDLWIENWKVSRIWFRFHGDIHIESLKILTLSTCTVVRFKKIDYWRSLMTMFTIVIFFLNLYPSMTTRFHDTKLVLLCSVLTDSMHRGGVQAITLLSLTLQCMSLTYLKSKYNKMM